MKQYFKRHIDKYLEEWKSGLNRKPLLVRGARQVGKSSTIRHLGKEFKYFVEINFERQKDIKTLFGYNLNVKNICAQLSAIYNTPIIPGETLLFFDEIQECIPSLDSTENIVEEIALTDILNRFLSSLSLEQRKIFMRRYWYLSPIKEIATEYGMSESKIKMSLFRSRNELKKLLEKEGISV